MSTETVSKKLFTIDEYCRLWDARILPHDGRFELIRGEIIEMSPVGPPHCGEVNRITQLFSLRLGQAVIVSVQNPVIIGSYTMPQPDLMLLKPRPDFYGDSHPGPDDVRLVVEVSNTSLAYDAQVKAPLYAEAGIGEYWQIDLENHTVIVRTDPVDGDYRISQTMHSGESVTASAFPEIAFAIDELLGARK